MTTTHDTPTQDTRRTPPDNSQFKSQCPACGCRAFAIGYGCTVCDYLVVEIEDSLRCAS